MTEKGICVLMDVNTLDVESTDKFTTEFESRFVKSTTHGDGLYRRLATDD